MDEKVDDDIPAIVEDLIESSADGVRSIRQELHEIFGSLLERTQRAKYKNAFQNETTVCSDALYKILKSTYDGNFELLLGCIEDMTEQMSEEVVEYPLCVILTIVTIVLKKKDINLPTSTTLIRVLSQVIQVFISACAQFGAKQKYKESVVNVLLKMGRLFPGILEETFMTDLQDMAIEVATNATESAAVISYADLGFLDRIADVIERICKLAGIDLYVQLVAMEIIHRVSCSYDITLHDSCSCALAALLLGSKECSETFFMHKYKKLLEVFGRIVHNYPGLKPTLSMADLKEEVLRVEMQFVNALHFEYTTAVVAGKYRSLRAAIVDTLSLPPDLIPLAEQLLEKREYKCSSVCVMFSPEAIVCAVIKMLSLGDNVVFVLPQKWMQKVCKASATTIAGVTDAVVNKIIKVLGECKEALGAFVSDEATYSSAGATTPQATTPQPTTPQPTSPKYIPGLGIEHSASNATSSSRKPSPSRRTPLLKHRSDNLGEVISGEYYSMQMSSIDEFDVGNFLSAFASQRPPVAYEFQCQPSCTSCLTIFGTAPSFMDLCMDIAPYALFGVRVRVSDTARGAVIGPAGRVIRSLKELWSVDVKVVDDSKYVVISGNNVADVVSVEHQVRDICRADSLHTERMSQNSALYGFEMRIPDAVITKHVTAKDMIEIINLQTSRSLCVSFHNDNDDAKLRRVRILGESFDEVSETRPQVEAIIHRTFALYSHAYFDFQLRLFEIFPYPAAARGQIKGSGSSVLKQLEQSTRTRIRLGEDRGEDLNRLEIHGSTLEDIKACRDRVRDTCARYMYSTYAEYRSLTTISVLQPFDSVLKVMTFDRFVTVTPGSRPDNSGFVSIGVQGRADDVAFTVKKIMSAVDAAAVDRGATAPVYRVPPPQMPIPAASAPQSLRSEAGSSNRGAVMQSLPAVTRSDARVQAVVVRSLRSLFAESAYPELDKDIIAITNGPHIYTYFTVSDRLLSTLSCIEQSEIVDLLIPNQRCISFEKLDCWGDRKVTIFCCGNMGTVADAIKVMTGALQKAASRQLQRDSLCISEKYFARFLIHRCSIAVVKGAKGFTCKEREVKYQVTIEVEDKGRVVNDMVFVQVKGSVARDVEDAAEDVLFTSSTARDMTIDFLGHVAHANKHVCPVSAARLESRCKQQVRALSSTKEQSSRERRESDVGKGGTAASSRKASDETTIEKRPEVVRRPLDPFLAESADGEHLKALAAFRANAHVFVDFIIPGQLLSDLSDSEQEEIVNLQVPNRLQIVVEARNTNSDDRKLALVCCDTMKSVEPVLEQLLGLLRRRVAPKRVESVQSSVRYNMRLLIPLFTAEAVVGTKGITCQNMQDEFKVKVAIDKDFPTSEGMVFVNISGLQSERVVKASERVLSLSSSTRELNEAERIQLAEANKRICPEAALRIDPREREQHAGAGVKALPRRERSESDVGKGSVEIPTNVELVEERGIGVRRPISACLAESADPEQTKAVGAIKQKAHIFVSFTIPDKLLQDLSDSEQSEILQLLVPNRLYIRFEDKWRNDRRVVVLSSGDMQSAVGAFYKLKAVLQKAMSRLPSTGSIQIAESYAVRILIHNATRGLVLGKGGSMLNSKKSIYKVDIEMENSSNGNDVTFIHVSGSAPMNVEDAAKDILILSISARAMTYAMKIQLIEKNQLVFPVECDRMDPRSRRQREDTQPPVTKQQRPRDHSESDIGRESSKDAVVQASSAEKQTGRSVVVVASRRLDSFIAESAFPEQKKAMSAITSCAHTFVTFTIPDKLLQDLSDSEQSEILQLLVPNRLYISFEEQRRNDRRVVVLSSGDMQSAVGAFYKLKHVLDKVITRRPEFKDLQIDGKCFMRIRIHRCNVGTLMNSGRSSCSRDIESRYAVKVDIRQHEPGVDDMIFVEVSGSDVKRVKNVIEAAGDLLSASASGRMMTNDQVIDLVEANKHVCPAEMSRLDPRRRPVTMRLSQGMYDAVVYGELDGLKSRYDVRLSMSGQVDQDGNIAVEIHGTAAEASVAKEYIQSKCDGYIDVSATKQPSAPILSAVVDTSVSVVGPLQSSQPHDGVDANTQALVQGGDVDRASAANDKCLLGLSKIRKQPYYSVSLSVQGEVSLSTSDLQEHFKTHWLGGKLHVHCPSSSQTANEVEVIGVDFNEVLRVAAVVKEQIRASTDKAVSCDIQERHSEQYAFPNQIQEIDEIQTQIDQLREKFRAEVAIEGKADDLTVWMKLSGFSSNKSLVECRVALDRVFDTIRLDEPRAEYFGSRKRTSSVESKCKGVTLQLIALPGGGADLRFHGKAPDQVVLARKQAEHKYMKHVGKSRHKRSRSSDDERGRSSKRGSSHSHARGGRSEGKEEGERWGAGARTEFSTAGWGGGVEDGEIQENAPVGASNAAQPQRPYADLIQGQLKQSSQSHKRQRNEDMQNTFNNFSKTVTRTKR